MNHPSRSAVALLLLSPFIGCESRYPAPVPETSVKTDVPAPAPSTPKTPGPTPRYPKTTTGESYRITSDAEEGPSRRLVEVKLDKKVTLEALREISLAVKAREERPHERTVIFYYLPVEFPEIDGLAWAAAYFKPGLEVKILGLSDQEEDALRHLPLDHKGKRIGAWLQDNQYKTLDLIYDDGGIKIAEIQSPTARTDSGMIELSSPNGRRFKKINGTNIYNIDHRGNLRISNGEGKVISAAKPMK
jgi:hypothetical protein